MEKMIEQWSVEKLEKIFPQIDFPEYQREPNLWSIREKQRLIDSMLRSFDIAPLYLYKHRTGLIDCVDGRQRIGTIMSFLGANQQDSHDNFRFKVLNEIYEDEEPPFGPLDGKTYEDIRRLGEESVEEEQAADPAGKLACQFLNRLHEYQLNVVMLSDSDRPQEFNLQFTRLNLGAIINAGEKLHAMVGELRDECFEGLGKHDFLEETNIPTRRFAREQVAATILAQIFSIVESGDPRSFVRTRHIDLQRLFKQQSILDNQHRTTIEKLSQLFDLLGVAFKETDVLRSRAITVSTVLLAWNRKVNTQHLADQVASFVQEFVLRLRWQLRKGLDVAPEYRYLTDFQRNVTQGTAGVSGVAARAEVFEREFDGWVKSCKLSGDLEYAYRTKLDPVKESRRN